MDLGIEGRVALVMGASKGIGRGIASALAAEGARLAVSSRSEENLAALVADLGSEQAAAYPADTGDLVRIRELPGEIERDLGPIEILVLNTGGPPRGARSSTAPTPGRTPTGRWCRRRGSSPRPSFPACRSAAGAHRQRRLLFDPRTDPGPRALEPRRGWPPSGSSTRSLARSRATGSPQHDRHRPLRDGAARRGLRRLARRGRSRRPRRGPGRASRTLRSSATSSPSSARSARLTDRHRDPARRRPHPLLLIRPR